MRLSLGLQLSIGGCGVGGRVGRTSWVVRSRFGCTDGTCLAVAW
jgi:hypothetical protein